MHELSIALSIIEGATEELERQGVALVSAVHLKLGPLSGVVQDALQFSWQLAIEGTPLNGARLIIEDAPIVLHCAQCQSDGPPVFMQRLHCARCGNASCEVIAGDELELRALEVQEEVPA